MIATAPLRPLATPARRARVPEKAQDGPHVHAHDLSTQIVIPCEPVSQPVRQAQDPLANRGIGQHVVNEVGRAFRHAAPTATRTEAASFAREWHQAIVAAGVTVKPGKSGGQTPTREEVTKLALHESRQPFPVTQRGRLRAEGLEVITHNLQEDALCGIARLVGSGCLGHAKRARVRRAARRRAECGRNRAILSSHAAIPAPSMTPFDRER